MEATTNGAAAAWRQRIAAQQSGGNSIRGWCRENNQHEHAFYWWRARLGLSPRSAVKGRRRAGRSIQFSEVVVASAAAEPMCLRLAGGRELILPASMPPEQVAKLIRVIEGAA